MTRRSLRPPSRYSVLALACILTAGSIAVIDLGAANLEIGVEIEIQPPSPLPDLDDRGGAQTGTYDIGSNTCTGAARGCFQQQVPNSLVDGRGGR